MRETKRDTSIDVAVNACNNDIHDKIDEIINGDNEPLKQKLMDLLYRKNCSFNCPKNFTLDGIKSLCENLKQNTKQDNYILTSADNKNLDDYKKNAFKYEPIGNGKKFRFYSDVREYQYLDYKTDTSEFCNLFGSGTNVKFVWIDGGDTLYYGLREMYRDSNVETVESLRTKVPCVFVQTNGKGYKFAVNVKHDFDSEIRRTAIEEIVKSYKTADNE